MLLKQGGHEGPDGLPFTLRPASIAPEETFQNAQSTLEQSLKQPLYSVPKIRRVILQVINFEKILDHLKNK